MRQWASFQPHPVIGVDEVGRGCLAGPVFAAAVILSGHKNYPDSKALTPEKREVLAGEIMADHCYGVGQASVQEIDKYNILQASFLSMERALLNLPTFKGKTLLKGHVLVDGPFPLPHLPKGLKQTPCIKGDKNFAPIGAASIVAKVLRDQWMKKKDKLFPHYGFASHKGYSTARHRLILAQKGPCPLHRKTFSYSKILPEDKK